MSALTEQEGRNFQNIGALMRGDDPRVQAALVRGTLDGEDVGVIVAVLDESDDGGHVYMYPHAVLVDDAIYSRLTIAGAES